MNKTSGATPVRFGMSCALLTPFDAHGRVDLVRLASHAADVLKRGCDGVTLCGTTGEGASIGLTERGMMLGALIAAGVPSNLIHVGIAASSLEEAVAQARQALDAGVRGLLVAPPFYFKGVSDDALFSWFSDFITRCDDARGVILYHIPSVTSVDLSIALVGRLKKAFPGVVTGVKDSSGNWDNTKALLEQHGELDILVGDERLLHLAIPLGAQGSICGMSNIIPERLRPVVHAGTHDPVLNALVDEVVARPIIPSIKAVLARQLGDEGWNAVRSPLTPSTAAERAEFLGVHDRLTGKAAA